MQDPAQVQDPLNNLLTDLGTRINEVEEKQRLLKDRLLLIGENLISSKEELDKQNFEFKKQLKQIDTDIKDIKQLNKRMVYEIGNFARKSEVEILERQLKMFSPLEFARIKDVKDIVKKELEKKK